MLLELYGVTGAERDGLIQLTREARLPGWRHSFRDVLPNPYEVYIGLEAGAASIRNFEPVVVPGLLQTADYAREIFRNGPIELDPDEVERLLEVRQARQEVLARDDRPRLWAVIDEAVIHRAHSRGAAHHVPQHALMQYLPQHRRVLASQDRLPFQPGANGTVDRRAAVPWLAPADDRVWQRVAKRNDLPSRDVR